MRIALLTLAAVLAGALAIDASEPGPVGTVSLVLRAAPPWCLEDDCIQADPAKDPELLIINQED